MSTPPTVQYLSALVSTPGPACGVRQASALRQHNELYPKNDDQQPAPSQASKSRTKKHHVYDHQSLAQVIIAIAVPTVVLWSKNTQQAWVRGHRIARQRELEFGEARQQ